MFAPNPLGDNGAPKTLVDKSHRRKKSATRLAFLPIAPGTIRRYNQTPSSGTWFWHSAFCSLRPRRGPRPAAALPALLLEVRLAPPPHAPSLGLASHATRSEEHTSELQSRQYLV